MEHITKCKVIGCRDIAGAKGLCQKHYKRLQRHGDVEHNSRPKAPGYDLNRKHPLYSKWRSITRRSKGTAVCDRWKSFLNFIKDLPNPPSEQHQLRRLDGKKPFSPDNYYWAAPLGTPEEKKKELSERQRLLRKIDPTRSKRGSLNKLYGITLEQYQAMLKSQEYTCKVCGKPEPRKNCSLSVDHCHSTGKVRDLLCSNCNTGLGQFQDSIEILQAAIDYLNFHSQA